MDTALKQRLIGAVVLVALAVIFLPMLIKGPAPESGVSSVPLDVPATPAGDYETRELPLVTPGQAPRGGAVGLGGRAPAASEAAADEAADTAFGSMLPPTTAGGNYAVNFGAYATTADAEAVIARLKQSGFPGYREPTIINGNTAYRVRIGPYADRASAETVRLQAGQVRSDVRTQVVALDAATPAAAAAATEAPPAAVAAAPAPKAEPARPDAAEPAPKPAAVAPSKPAPAAAPAAASVGFAVQVGAFSKAADANALRDKLRAGGFSAFVEQVQTDKGTLSRVRVGPVSNRADADQLKAKVAADTGMSGMVLSHP
jgi:cell division septation protein DedD